MRLLCFWSKFISFCLC